MPSKTVLCSDCDREKQIMDSSPHTRFVSCTPIAGRPGFCEIQYELTFAATPATPPAPDVTK